MNGWCWSLFCLGVYRCIGTVAGFIAVWPWAIRAQPVYSLTFVPMHLNPKRYSISFITSTFLLGFVYFDKTLCRLAAPCLTFFVLSAVVVYNEVGGGAAHQQCTGFVPPLQQAVCGSDAWITGVNLPIQLTILHTPLLRINQSVQDI